MTAPDPYDPMGPDANPGWTQPQPVDGQPSYGQPTYGQPTYPMYPSAGPAGGFPPPLWPGGMAYPPYGVDAYGRPLSDKSKVVAGVLGIVLGGFGVGRFYIGDNRTGVWQLVVTLLTCGLGHLWGFVDGILILINGGVDAQGRVLRD